MSADLIAQLEREEARLNDLMREAYAEVDSRNNDLNALFRENPEHPLLKRYDEAVYFGHRAGDFRTAIQAICEHKRAEPWPFDHSRPDHCELALRHPDAQHCPDCRKTDWYGNLQWTSPSDAQRAHDERMRP